MTQASNFKAPSFKIMCFSRVRLICCLMEEIAELKNDIWNETTEKALKDLRALTVAFPDKYDDMPLSWCIEAMFICNRKGVEEPLYNSGNESLQTTYERVARAYCEAIGDIEYGMSRIPDFLETATSTENAQEVDNYLNNTATPQK